MKSLLKGSLSLFLCLILALSLVPFAGAYIEEKGQMVFNNEDMLSYVSYSHSLDIGFDSIEHTMKLIVNSQASDPDPYIGIDCSGFTSAMTADSYKYAVVTYRVPAAVSSKATTAELFLCAGSITAPTGGRSVTFSLTKGAPYVSQIINLSQIGWWTGKINAVRLDPFTSASAGDTFYLDSIIFTQTAAQAESAKSDRLSKTYSPTNADKYDDSLCTSYNVSKYTSPIWEGNIIYNEAVYPVKDKNGNAVYTLMYTPDNVLSVFDATFSTCLAAGSDYTVSGNKLTLSESGAVKLVEYNYIHPQSNPNNYDWSRYYNRKAAGDGKWEYWGQSAEFFAGYLNVTYTHSDEWTGYVPDNKSDILPRTAEAITNRSSMNVVFFGDSICGGANASSYRNVYPYAEYWNQQIISKLKNDLECTGINAYYSSVGGSTASGMLSQLESSVLKYSPDLVFIEFGMNDAMNASQDSDYSAARLKSEYKQAIESMITQTRAQYPNCEFALVAPFYGNIYCHYQSYFDACRDALNELENSYAGVAVADVTSMHSYLLTFKDYLDFSGDNMCHPNDFMSRIYAQICLETIVPGGIQAYVPENSDPVINSVTPTSSTVTDTGSATYTVSAAGGSLSYIWTCSDPRVTLSGENTPTLTVSVISQLKESFEAEIICTVTNEAGKSVSSAPVSFVYTTTYSGLKGDTNGDGRISVSDVNMMKRALVGVVTIEDMYAYDVNGDGRFSVSDLNGLLRLLAGV